MISDSLRSAEKIYAWNQSAVAVNNENSKVRRNYDLNEQIAQANLSTEDENALLVKLTGKRKTMLEGAVFMLKNKTFTNFKRALSLLNNANNAYGLGAVEAALQTQIDAIREMNTQEMTPDNKTLCIYTLQNMIFALSDYTLPNGKENDYVPKVLQDQYQMLLKGSTFNLEWDGLYNSVYATQYQDKNNPTLANWKFLDNNLIQENMDNLAHYQATHDETYLQGMRTEKVAQPVEQVVEETKQTQPGVKSWGAVELQPSTNVEINRMLNQAMLQFNSKNLKDNLKDFFNFFKDPLAAQNQNVDAVNYPLLHEVVLSAMHKIVNIGNEQQKKSLVEQAEDKSL